MKKLLFILFLLPLLCHGQNVGQSRIRFGKIQPDSYSTSTLDRVTTLHVSGFGDSTSYKHFDEKILLTNDTTLNIWFMRTHCRGIGTINVYSNVTGTGRYLTPVTILSKTTSLFYQLGTTFVYWNKDDGLLGFSSTLFSFSTVWYATYSGNGRLNPTMELFAELWNNTNAMMGAIPLGAATLQGVYRGSITEQTVLRQESFSIVTNHYFTNDITTVNFNPVFTNIPVISLSWGGNDWFTDGYTGSFYVISKDSSKAVIGSSFLNTSSIITGASYFADNTAYFELNAIGRRN